MKKGSLAEYVTNFTVGAAGTAGTVLGVMVSPVGTLLTAGISFTEHFLVTQVNPRLNHGPIYKDIDRMEDEIQQLKERVRKTETK